jgi:hypothetical protein
MPFNPALAGRFFPLRSGLSWTYQVTYPNGAHGTINGRVVEADASSTSHAAALIVSDYSGQGISAVRAEPSQTYPRQMTEIDTRYVIENGYISRLATLGGPTSIGLDEHNFLPQYLRPDRAWSNKLSPFDQLADEILTITQNHRSFLESREVVVPAGRFTTCIRIETRASYSSPAGLGGKRYFTDWYAPDVGLVKTRVASGGPDGPELARIELLRFAKSDADAALRRANAATDSSLSSTLTNAPVSAHPLTHR